MGQLFAVAASRDGISDALYIKLGGGGAIKSCGANICLGGIFRKWRLGCYRTVFFRYERLCFGWHELVLGVRIKKREALYGCFPFLFCRFY